MKFMMMIKAAEGQPAPPQSLFDAMDQYVAKGLSSGVVISTGGFMPTAAGKRVSIRNGKIQVTDGPFTETKEVIGGYAICEYASLEEAVAGGREFMQLHIDHYPGWEGTSEIREIAFMPE